MMFPLSRSVIVAATLAGVLATTAMIRSVDAFVGPASHRRCVVSTRASSSVDSDATTSSSSLSLSSSSLPFDPTFVPPDMAKEYDVSDPFAVAAAALMRRVDVAVPESVSASGKVGVSYVRWEPEKKSGLLPLLLVHGFDSSCLEFRRLGPALAELGVETYAVDLLGWGYSRLDDDVRDRSADAKAEVIRRFWTTVDGGPVCVGGASLGGAAAIETASSSDAPYVAAAVLIDAQGFTDGIGPPSMLPPFLARLGVKVLKSEPLRRSANDMSYFDRDTFATEDAMRIGRAHCLYHGDGRWEDAQLDFIKSGGFYPSQKVRKVTQPTLVLWGREDGILDGETETKKFMRELPDAELRWIEECGHVPHIEKAEETASLIHEFLLRQQRR